MLASHKLTIDDVDIFGQKVMVRVDYNVPIENGIIQDDRRIRASLPTIRKILSENGIPILISHLGRPNGKRNDSLSLAPIAGKLSELLGKPVTFVRDCIGDEARTARKRAIPGDIFLLENLRFHIEEEENDDDFARELLGEVKIYVNDAFGTCHRVHASVVAITKYAEYDVAGYLLNKELEMLLRLIENPKRPFTSIVGGAKVSSKIGIIENMLDKCDRILIGGGMAWTFFSSLGIDQGQSLVETDRLDVARRILEKAEAHFGLGGRIFLPIDTIVTDDITGNGIRKVVPYDHVPHGLEAVDIGPDTVSRYKEEISNSNTIVMNGPLGVFEVDKFSIGTREVLKSIAERVDQGGIGIIGGGETAAAAAKYGLADRMTHISTGGGASLKLLEGKSLPGVDALRDRKKFNK